MQKSIHSTDTAVGDDTDIMVLACFGKTGSKFAWNFLTHSTYVDIEGKVYEVERTSIILSDNISIQTFRISINKNIHRGQHCSQY